LSTGKSGLPAAGRRADSPAGFGYGSRAEPAACGWRDYATAFRSASRANFAELICAPQRKLRSRYRVPLGLLMLSRGELTHAQLRAALSAQRQAGAGRVGEWAQKLGFTSEQQVTAALGAQWGCPVLRSLPEQMPRSGLPLSLMQRFQTLPVHFAHSTRTLHLAFGSGIDYRLLLATEKMLECQVQACIASPSEVRAALTRMAEDDGDQQADPVFEDVFRPEEMTRVTSSYASRLGAEDVRLASCGECVWVRIEASKQQLNLLFSGHVAEGTPRYRLPDTPVR